MACTRHTPTRTPRRSPWMDNLTRGGIVAVLMLTLALMAPARAESTAISENLPLDVQVDLLMTELRRLLDAVLCGFL